MSKCSAMVLVLVAFAASCVITFVPVQAESRTVVVPDDYSTIVAAVDNAKDGDTVFVKKGTYEEHSLIINKTLALMGEDKSKTVINDIDPLTLSYETYIPTESANIRFAADNIKITGFTLTGGARGIEGKGDRTQIIDNIILAQVVLEGSNQTITQNSIERGVLCIGSQNNIMENEFVGTSCSGIGLDGSHNVVYDNVIIDGGGIAWTGDSNIIAKNNITGLFATIHTKGSDNLVCANRVINGSGIAAAGFNNVFYANHIESNRKGAQIGDLTGERSRPRTDNTTLYHNNFVNNEIQVWTDYPVYGTDYFDNGEEGNYWSDYNGSDMNHDGIGDTPYIIDAGRRDNFPVMVPFDVGSVAGFLFNSCRRYLILQCSHIFG